VDSLALRACNAHGGLRHWHGKSSVTARVLVERTSAGRVFSTEFGLESGTQLELVCMDDYGPEHHVTSFMPNRVELLDSGGTLLSRGDPASMQDWQGRLGLSDNLGDICSLSLSMWTYLNFPFLMALDGFSCTEQSAVVENGEERRTVLVAFPPDDDGGRSRVLAHIAPNGRTRQVDWYAGNQSRVVSVAHMVDYVDTDGLLLPSHIVAHHRCADRTGPDAAFSNIFLTEVSIV
jgi:hypothetical protein